MISDFNVFSNRDVTLYLIQDQESSVTGQIVGFNQQGVFLYSKRDDMTYFYGWNTFYLEVSGNIVNLTKAA